jgi:hypothetical protein
MIRIVISFSRLAVGFLGATSFLALIVSFLHEQRDLSLPLGENKVDAMSSSVWPDRREDQPICYLIDRESEWCNPMPVPFSKQWGQLSVSPWCDAKGNTVAVCQSFGLPGTGEEQSCWRLARLQLPAGEVIEEVKLDLLPTGRAFWVPDHPGRIVFAAGDGLLYRHDLPGWAPESGEGYADEADSSNESVLLRVSWKGNPPAEVGKDGRIRLVYLTNVGMGGMSCLDIVPIELDRESGFPCCGQ